MKFTILLLLGILPCFYGSPTTLKHGDQPIKPETPLPHPVKTNSVIIENIQVDSKKQDSITNANVEVKSAVDGVVKLIPNSGEKLLDQQESISADSKKQQQSANAHIRKYKQGNIRSESSEINLKSKLDKVHGDYSRTKTGDTDIVDANYGYTKDDRQAGDKQRRLDVGANHFVSRDQYSDRNLTEGSGGVQIINSPGYKEYKSSKGTHSEQDHSRRSYRKYIHGNEDSNSEEISTDAPITTTDGKPTTVDDYNTNTTPDRNWFTATAATVTDQGTTSSVADHTTEGRVTITYFTTPTETTRPIPNSGEKLLDQQESISADSKKQQQSANAHIRKYKQGNIRSESSEINLKSKLDKVHGDYSRTKTGDTDIVDANYGYTKDDRQADDKQRRLDVGANHFVSRDQYSDRNLTEGSGGVQIINSPGYKEYKSSKGTHSEQDHSRRSYRKYIHGNEDSNSEEISTDAPITTTDGKPTTVDDYNTNTTPDRNWFTATAATVTDQGTTSSVADHTTEGRVTITYFTTPTETTRPIPNSGEKLLDQQESISADSKKQQQSANAHIRKYKQGNIRSESSEINLKSKLDKVHGDYSRTKTGDTDIVDANYGYTKDDRQADDKQRRLDVGANHFVSRDQYSDRNLTEGSGGVQIINSPGYKEYKSSKGTHSEQDHSRRSYRKYIHGNEDSNSEEISTDAPITTTDGKPTTVDDYNTNTTPDRNWFTATAATVTDQGPTSSVADHTTDGRVTITYFTTPTETTRPIPNSGEKLLDQQESISADSKKQQQSANAHIRKYKQGNIRSESSEINLKSKLDKVHGDYSRTKTGDTDIVDANYGYTKDDRQAGDKQRRLDVGVNHFVSRDQYSERNLTEGSGGVQIINSPGYKEYKSSKGTHSEQDHSRRSYGKYIHGNEDSNSEEISTDAPITTTDGKPTTVDDYNTNTTPDRNWFTATAATVTDQGPTSSVADHTTDGRVTITYFTTPTETTRPIPNSGEKLLDKQESISVDSKKQQQSAN